MHAMELLLQWLDDLDDLLLTAAASWEHLRRWCLAAGLIAALGLAGMGRQQTLAGTAVVLAIVAGTCVAVWLAGASFYLWSRARARQQRTQT
jgi:hypothetical protein